jgi:hypothetical protein
MSIDETLWRLEKLTIRNSWDKPYCHLYKLSDYPFSEPSLLPMPQLFLCYTPPPTLDLICSLSFSLPVSSLPFPGLLSIQYKRCIMFLRGIIE